ncbi:hypothetical protein ERD78_18930 [Allopusillimonas soli]|uniref:Uncharacterized protein n=1 Tax=Allopusillimonas soli TaxID=659016 RepID=A0A853FLT0_9BURK|nr:hypothetical protein [Allopusillimonas soli]NYT38856.1 hypothetical protein [Allopusillimonas soli]TEA70144.1 hypothetical protein ERD78_18930 [Allopusillimonas soli]
MQYTEVSNLHYTASDGSLIGMDVFFVELGETVPFNACAADIEAHGVELYNRAVAGDFGPIAPFVAPAPIIPQRVTAAQGGIALIQAGLMDAVQAAVDDAQTPAEVKWAWAKARDWERPSPALAYLADKAGITSAQMDDLFTAAAQIQA